MTDPSYKELEPGCGNWRTSARSTRSSTVALRVHGRVQRHPGRPDGGARVPHRGRHHRDRRAAQPGQADGPRAVHQVLDYFYGDDGPLPYVFQTSVADKVEVDDDTAVQRSNMLGIFQPAARSRPSACRAGRTPTCAPRRLADQKTTVDGGFSAPLPRSGET